MSIFPQRIVSLVPSLTELLFALGAGDRVVGVTEWCIHPAPEVAKIPKVGGTKNPDIKTICALKPDLVIVNHEENRKIDVERLEEKGVRILLTYPRTVPEAANMIRDVGSEIGCAEDAECIAYEITQALQQLSSVKQKARVFCPIWFDPWMTVNRDTYMHDLIMRCGGENVFGEHSTRYPKITAEEIAATNPEIVLLPSEPYQFAETEAKLVREMNLPAAKNDQIHFVDGTLLSWYGPRITSALTILPQIIQGQLSASESQKLGRADYSQSRQSG